VSDSLRRCAAALADCERRVGWLAVRCVRYRRAILGLLQVLERDESDPPTRLEILEACAFARQALVSEDPP